MRTLILMILFSQLLCAEELLFFQNERSQWHVTGGTVTLSDESFTLRGSASIDMKTPDFFPPQSGEISFFLRHHLHDPSPITLVQESMKRCHCALKLRLGILEFEIGESHVEVHTLKENLTIDRVLAKKSFELNKCGEEFLVTLRFDADSIALFIGKQQELTIPNRAFNLHDITLSTFMGQFTVTSFSIESNKSADIIVDTVKKEVLIPALYKPDQFNRPLMLQNHHLVTWLKGKAAAAALFVTPVPDALVHNALREIGAIPGNNLTTDSWNKRHSKRSTDPDIISKGTPLQIRVRKGSQRFSIASILHDEHNHAYNFVFSGNLAFIPVWHSGCVICLQSCPGSKVANATYTMRDLAQKRVAFTLKENTLSPGEAVWIEFSFPAQSNQ